MRSICVLVAGSLLIGGYAVAQELAPSCKTSPHVVTACFTVHGRLSVYNGFPSIIIWQIGTNHILGILDPQSETEGPRVIPPTVRALLGSGPSFNDVYGDYEVCPFDRLKPGQRQIACIESASHLIARQP